MGFISAFTVIVQRLWAGDGLGNFRFLREYADFGRRASKPSAVPVVKAGWNSPGSLKMWALTRIWVPPR